MERHFSFPASARTAWRLRRTRVEKKIASLGNNLVAGWLLLGLFWIMMLGIVIAADMTFEGTAVLLATAIAAGLAFFLTRHFHRKRDALWNADKPSLPPNAIGYAFAAFLINTQGFMGNKRSTFAAARQEWLDLLLAENPGEPR